VRMPGWSAALCGRHLSMSGRKEGEPTRPGGVLVCARRGSPGQSVGSALHPALQPGPSRTASPLAPRTQLEKVWQGDEVTLVVPVSGTEHLVTYLPVQIEITRWERWRFRDRKLARPA